MSLEVTFFGGAGDYEKGELGGVQVLFKDNGLNSSFLLDCGQRPDHTSQYYGFPYHPSSYQSLDLSESLELYPLVEGIYRHDYEIHRGNKIKNPSVDGLLVTHGHYDHVGGLPLIRHDLPTYMNRLTKQVLYVWQNTGSRLVNQFVDYYDQFSLGANTSGGEKFLFGKEAILPRDIRIYEPEERFKIGNILMNAYYVDHSLPGSCAFIIETSTGNFGISADFRKRGRHPEFTENYIKNLEDQKGDLKYFMCEGSLLHFEHNGTENDIIGAVSELIKGKNFVGIAYPLRDMDRVRTLYDAAEKNNRMFVISPSQAIYLQMLDGVNGYPRLNWKYIGVLLPRKRKGLIDRPDFPIEMAEQDYFAWERKFLGRPIWEGHQSKFQRIRLEDIKNNQDKFIVSITPAHMLGILDEVKPIKNSIYIRSHPGPWTMEMEIQEQRQIKALKQFGLYDGPQPDFFTRSIMRNMHQVHVTGHLNRNEVRETLERVIVSNPNVTIIPYHSMYPKDFPQDVAKTAKHVLVPKRLKRYNLE